MYVHTHIYIYIICYIYILYMLYIYIIYLDSKKDVPVGTIFYPKVSESAFLLALMCLNDVLSVGSVWQL
jgi:hypothetical protein